MDWQFIARHMICGYLPMTAALALYFIALWAMGKKQTAAHVIASYVFCFYLVGGILTTTGVCIRGELSPRIVYVPFVDMVRGPVDTILNVLLFVPLGVFLPLLYGKFNMFGKVVLAGFLISLSIEIAQMFGTGATDINDLITNTAGACLGFGAYRLLYKAIPKSWIKQIRVEGCQCYIELLLFWLGALLIMLTIQTQIYYALYPRKTADIGIQVWE